MDRALAGFMVMLAMNLGAGFTHAGEPRLVVGHSLTGYSKAASSVTLDYSLFIVNPGDTPLTDLSLSLVPLPPLTAQGTPASISYLGPKQSAQLFIQVVSPGLLDEERFSQRPLFWAGRYIDMEGKQVEFPVQSKPGGAR